MIVRRAIAPVVVALAATVLLTACPGPVPNPAPTTPQTASPAPAPTLPAGVAFVVTGTFEAPGGGTIVDATMTVEAPTQSNAAADAAAFAASVHCPPDALLATPPTITDPAYLHVTTELRMSAGGYVPEAGVSFGAPGFAATWAGDYQTAQAYCAPPSLFPTGTATAIGLLENGVVTGPGGWIPDTGGYGISVWDISVPFSVVACDIEFGPASAGTPAADFIRVDATTGCSFGLRDTP